MDGPELNGEGSLAAQLAGLEPGPAQRMLQQRLCREVAAFLQLPEAEVDARTGFVALGFDSLRAVDFRARLERLLGIELRSTLLFDQPDCERLAEFVLAQLGPWRRRLAGTAAAARLPAPRSQSTGDAAARGEDDIVIVGMACRFPGPARDLASFWQLLADGRCAVGDVPAGRWPIDELFDPDASVPGRIYTRRGGFLPAIEQFDAAFFGISPVEATMLDPQQRLLLEVAWETFEDAAVPPEQLRTLRPGVFVGMRASEYFQSQCARLPEDADAYYATGNAVSTAAGRLSYFFGFRGPCFALDTACSGSLVAVHQALQSLRAGECRAALAGGVNTLVDPLSSVGLCRARMLSADGLCKTFDARADGYGRAEGCGLVLLMRRGDARALGLRARAVVRGSAINQDGRTGGLTVPHGPSQEAVIRAALADAGLRPDDIDYVEAHGTGTALGDPIEVGALDAVFAGRRAAGRLLPVGSVKTNVGHLEAAAGISGLLKVALALEHGTLPAHLHLEQKNPHVDWARTEIDVAVQARPWPRSARPRRAGVSSFGFSGTNAHVVLEEGDAPRESGQRVESGRTRPQRPQSERAQAERAQPVVLSAATETALRQQAARWSEALASSPMPALADVAFTAGHGRTHLPHRLGVVAADVPQLAARLRAFAAGATEGVASGHARTPPRVAFVFTGQGAARAGAGRELYRDEPVFRAAIDRMAAVFDRVRDVRLVDVLFGDDAELLRRTDYAQPASFALQWALVELWRSAGVEPAVVLGHSVGEIAAACAAGVLAPEDGLRLCAARGALMLQHCRPGAMLAVFAGRDAVATALAAHPSHTQPSDWAFAAINGPSETVLSGGTDALADAARRLEAAGLRSQPLDVSHAFHSPRMEPMLAPFGRLLGRTALQPPRVPLAPCRAGADGRAVATAEHWLRHVTEPVDFAAAVAAAAPQADVWIEIGPSPVLLSLLARMLPSPPQALPSLRARVGEREGWLRGLVHLHLHGAPIDFAAVTAADAPQRTALPGYAFERQRFWLQQKAAPARATVHALAGAPLPSLLLGPQQRLFEGALAPDAPAWLADHCVQGRPLLPAAALCECALGAAAHAFGGAAFELRDVAIGAALWLEARPTTIQVLLDGGEDGARFKIARRDGDQWREHASGVVGVLAEAPAAPQDAGPAEPVDVEELYADYAAAGLDYGPAFRAVRAASRAEGAAHGEVALPAGLHAAAASFTVHPVLLDACFQLAGAALQGAGQRGLWLPVGIERLCVLRPPGVEGTVRARVRSAGERSRLLDLALFDGSGRATVVVLGLQLLAASSLAAADGARWLHTIGWQRRPRPEATRPEALKPEATKPEARNPGATGPEVAVSEVPWIVAAPRGESGLAAPLSKVGVRARPLPFAAARNELRGVSTLVVDATAEMPEDAAGLAALLAELAQLVRAAASATPVPRLLLVTRDAVAADVLDGASSPGGAALWGFLRTVALEHPELRPRCIDLEARARIDVAVPELRADDDEDLVALRGDQRLAARLLAGTSRSGDVALPQSSAWRLRCAEYGRLEQLRAEPIAAAAPGRGEVAIAVAAAGLNFKDVLHALGLLREWSEARGIHSAADQPLGFECAGTVTAVGPGVEDLAPGTRVLACAEDLLRSDAVVPRDRVVALPDGVDLAAAAGLPTVFATALHALVDVARVRAGERVLVHAAAGGVGLAALQVCRRAGCTVFATSSRGKRDWLLGLGVAGWADSRDPAFAAAIRASSGGVDVVLNSLSGDAIEQSLGLLRQGGRFVEIGKRGIWTAERMAAARPDVRYTAFDLAELAAADRALVPGLLARLQQGLADGSLRPLATTPVPVQRAPEAFAAMAKGRHVGKIVLTLPRPVEIRADRTWVLSGGTGALARAVARALAERGARHIALLARRAPTPAERDELAGLAPPASVRVFVADVADAAPVATAAREVRESMPPVQGVLHLAGVLHDALLRDLEPSHLAQVLRPKVDGARNLARAFDGVGLDVFAASTSMAGWFGNQGQAAYSAANAWLDAFCCARSAAGRRSLALAFGPWAEAGMAARMGAREQGRLRDLGIAPIPPAAGAALTVQALTEHERSLGVLPVRWPQFARQFGGRLPPLLRSVAAAAAAPVAGPAPGALRQGLLQLEPAKREAALRAEVRQQLAQVLGFASPEQLDADRSFGELGVDSLLAVEIRTRLGRALDLPLPATLLFDHPDAVRLAAHLLSLLPPSSASSATSAASAASAAPAAPAAPATSGASATPAASGTSASASASASAPEHPGTVQTQSASELARALEAQVRAMERRA